MANSAYTRSYSQQSADWAYQKAQMGISQSLAATAMQNQYNTQANKLAIGNRNANNAIQATSLNTGLDNTTYINNQRADLAQLNNVVNGVVGVAGNAASGNVGGAVSALGGAVMNGVNTEANRSINNTAAQLSAANSLSTNAATTSQANTYGSQTTALSNQLAQNMADMNADYAQRSAFGDYQNTIAGINAQVQQMQLTPPDHVRRYRRRRFQSCERYCRGVGSIQDVRTLSSSERRRVHVTLRVFCPAFHHAAAIAGMYDQVLILADAGMLCAR